MARMITKQENHTCHWGYKCCAEFHGNSSHHKASRERARRTLKRRDRAAGKAECRG